MPCSFHHNEQYNGHNNQAIKNLKKQISFHEKIIEEAEKDIRKIQSECNHYYQFSSRGMYEDNYVCKHCGHETEN